MHPLLQLYIPLVDFLSNALGTNTEVVLHDVTDLNHSVVAIKNNHISGRSVGAPVTDMTLQILSRGNSEQISYITNYSGKLLNGKTLYSSTFFIRNSETIVGMLCLNTDYSELESIVSTLHSFTSGLHLSDNTCAISETFNTDAKSLIESNLASVYPDYKKVEKPNLSRKQKQAIICKLNDMGTFLLKGAVLIVAKAIGVSVPTVYRYISESKNKDSDLPGSCAKV